MGQNYSAWGSTLIRGHQRQKQVQLLRQWRRATVSKSAARLKEIRRERERKKERKKYWVDELISFNPSSASTSQTTQQKQEYLTLCALECHS